MTSEDHAAHAEDYIARAYELPGQLGDDISPELLAQLALAEALLAVRSEIQSLKIRLS